MKRSLAVVSLASLALVCGCDQGTAPAPKGSAGVMDKAKDAAAKTVDNAKEAAHKGTEAVKDAAHGAAEGVKDAAHKGTEAVKETAGKAGEAAKGAMAALQAEGGKWLTDTVEKQWPAAKATLDDLTKKATDVKDAGLKTKITESLKSLTGQTTEIEGLVGQLKNFKGEGDYGSLFTKAKDMFSGFMKKLDEVKAMMPK